MPEPRSPGICLDGKPKSVSQFNNFIQPVRATPEGTDNYRRRFAGRLADQHFRQSQNLWFSSIGLGTYLGPDDTATDQLYCAAAREALRLGCNVIDTAINYRNQRSERAIGQAIAEANAAGEVRRDEIIIATKGGYLPFDGTVPADPEAYIDRAYIQSGITRKDAIVEWNCIAPGYIDDQVERSRANLNLECIDIYYLHNPETQLEERGLNEFHRQLREAFAMLETKIREGKIGMYGLATWDGFRREPSSYNYLSLADVISCARDAAGRDHHFRVVQLPFNLAMPEALALRNQPVDGKMVSFLEAARHFGVTVMTSVPTLQGRLSRGLPPQIADALPGLSTDAQRAIQFVRSAPGVTTPLVGMKQLGHVRENLQTAAHPPATEVEFRRLFQA
jgi:aryl-alcohol dehydrogenase-like predicted oxidoreductase